MPPVPRRPRISYGPRRAPMLRLMGLLPVHEGHRVAGPCFRAIARDLVDLVIAPALGIHRRDDGNPVLDLRRADFKYVLRQASQTLLVAMLHGSEHRLIQLFIDDEMTQPAGRHHRDTA